MNLVGILDVGVGNIKSIHNIFDSLNLNTVGIKDENQFNLIDILIIPGVGNYNHLNLQIKKFKLLKKLNNWIKSDKPTIGICLGGQFLFEESEESLKFRGIGHFNGKVKKFSKSFCNTGWNTVKFKNNYFESSKFYFNHSYYFDALNKSEIYGIININNRNIPVFIKKSNIYALQFHPEKSKNNGKLLLKKIIDKWI